jgi:hypothetical protein
MKNTTKSTKPERHETHEKETQMIAFVIVVPTVFEFRAFRGDATV